MALQAVTEMWNALERRARIGIVIGVIAILGSAAAVAMWAYRPDYQILFAELAPRDAAAMTAELDKMKLDYKLGDNGTSILVPRELVYRTRLKLMGGELPLQGAVGFEVFNNADFGMTEFVQRINYLRAVQGELTRTIQSIDGIQAARVHLAIPEQGLFKKSVTKPKASVTLTLQPRQQLSAEQISGIQRLVAASVPDIAIQDVTLLDQHGVALTRPAGNEAGNMDGAQLDVKRSTEDYLQKKISAVLEQTFGPGEALASVDVVLAADHGTVTTEEVLPGRAAQGQGVIVHQRSNAQDIPGATSTGEHPPAAANNSSETDYQVGRRVEQRTVPSGELKRMTIAVVVKQRLTPAQLERVREVVALAVGLNPSRGDAIVVNSVNELVNPAPAVAALTAVEPTDSAPQSGAPGVTHGTATVHVRATTAAAETVVIVLAGLFTMVLVAGLIIILRKRRRAAAPRDVTRLDDKARAEMLAEIRDWIAKPNSTEFVGHGQ